MLRKEKEAERLNQAFGMSGIYQIPVGQVQYPGPTPTWTVPSTTDGTSNKINIP
jgi:hypothetical protein